MFPKKAVVTMPMNPSHVDKIGFMSIFAYTHAMAVQKQAMSVYAVNLYGKCTSHDALQKFSRAVSTLAITPTEQWVDTCIDTSCMQNVFAKLWHDGFFSEEITDVSRCACGRVEYLANTQLYSSKKSLIKNDCSLCCHTKIITAHEQVILTAPLPRVQIPEVFPLWAGKDLQHVLQELAGTRLLVSRSTERIFQFSTRWLDNDLVWWLYLYWLQQRDESLQVECLVAGASIVRQVGVLIAFSQLIGTPLPKSVSFLPKVFFDPLKNVRSLDQLIARFGTQRTVNALVWSALSERKQFVLSGSMLPNMNEAEGGIQRTKLRITK